MFAYLQYLEHLSFNSYDAAFETALLEKLIGLILKQTSIGGYANRWVGVLVEDAFFWVRTKRQLSGKPWVATYPRAKSRIQTALLGRRSAASALTTSSGRRRRFAWIQRLPSATPPYIPRFFHGRGLDKSRFTAVGSGLSHLSCHISQRVQDFVRPQCDLPICFMECSRIRE